MRGLIFLVGVALAAQSPKGWVKGKGYGWVYGKTDEIGALNAVLSPAQVAAALKSVTTGQVYDLGVAVDRKSFKWPGHSATEVMSYRSPAGVKSLKDMPGFGTGARGLAWHSCALFISDNVGTQIDGLGHITRSVDNSWYNGYKEATDGDDFGVRKADADSIPPIVARAVLIDVAGWKNVDALPGNYAIGPEDLQAALKAQGADVVPGDIVMIRTGTLRYWGVNGADHSKIAAHDSAGINLEAAKWLVEQKGAVMIGSDTSGLEVGADPKRPGVVIPVHEYLLIEQGVHIGEFHNLEGLARDKVYRFTYVATTNRVKGAVAGFAMRPIAIR
ncbi:MAG: cyclase family protein [Bryobacteraceae bacterium]|nr:cyclase family protein [Bryobacteraceae bacterium]